MKTECQYHGNILLFVWGLGILTTMVSCRLVETSPTPAHQPTQAAVVTMQPTLPATATEILPTIPPAIQPSPTLSSPTAISALPAPPSDLWVTYIHPDSGIRFQYPENWFVLAESGSIFVSNFSLTGMPSKGNDETKFKLDMAAAPVDISEYPSLEAYLNAPEQQPAPDALGKIVEQTPIQHHEAGYTAIRQVWTGLMGDETATYVKIYVASEGKMVLLLVYGKGYRDVADEIAATLTFP